MPLINSLQLESLIIYAARYALGRMTYAVSDMLDVFIEHHDILRPRARIQLAKEIQQAIDNDQAGMEMDVAIWKEVLTILRE